MTTLVLASFGTWLLAIPLVGVSVLLIGLVLLQKNRGSGLSGAFGGVGGNSAFGAKTGDFMTWLTVGLTAVFLVLSVVGNYVFEPGKVVSAAPQLSAPGAGEDLPQEGAPPIEASTDSQAPVPAPAPSAAPVAPSGGAAPQESASTPPSEAKSEQSP